MGIIPRAGPEPNVCPFEYEYDYYNDSQCKVTKQAKYLKIVCWDKSEVTIGSASNLSLREMRLYSPSINKWNGSKADAEIILKHKGGNGDTVSVCIPVEEGSSSDAGADITFFDSVHEAIKVLNGERNGTMRAVELGGGFTLNNLIPRNKFYYADGDGIKFGTRACDADTNKIVIFPLDKPIKLKPAVLTSLKALISSVSVGSRREVVGSENANGGEIGGKFLINEVGTTGAGISGGLNDRGDMALECEAVNDTTTGRNVSDPNAKMDVSDKFSGLPKEKIWEYVGIVLGIIAGLGLIFAIYWIGVPKVHLHYKRKPRAEGKKISRLSNFIAKKFGWIEGDDE